MDDPVLYIVLGAACCIQGFLGYWIITRRARPASTDPSASKKLMYTWIRLIGWGLVAGSAFFLMLMLLESIRLIRG